MCLKAKGEFNGDSKPKELFAEYTWFLVNG